MQDFNNRPYEVLRTRNTNGLFSALNPCSEQDGACGFVEKDGVRVPYSGGFCCSCSLGDMVGVTDEPTRVDSACGLFSGDQQGWAHCIRMDALWYR